METKYGAIRKLYNEVFAKNGFGTYF